MCGYEFLQISGTGINSGDQDECFFYDQQLIQSTRIIAKASVTAILYFSSTLYDLLQSITFCKWLIPGTLPNTHHP